MGGCNPDADARDSPCKLASAVMANPDLGSDTSANTLRPLISCCCTDDMQLCRKVAPSAATRPGDDTVGAGCGVHPLISAGAVQIMREYKRHMRARNEMIASGPHCPSMSAC